MTQRRLKDKVLAKKNETWRFDFSPTFVFDLGSAWTNIPGIQTKFDFILLYKKSATALCSTAWLRGHEFRVLSSVLESWLMVYGFVFE